MAYTAAQQERITAANARVASASAKHAGALSGYNTVYNDFCGAGWWSYLTDCDIRNAQSRWVNRAQGVAALYTLGLSLLYSNFTQKRWAKPTSCDNAIEKGILLTWECQRGGGDCIKSETCNSKVAQYNSKLGGVNNASRALASAKVELDAAQKDLQTLLNTIDSEVKGDPTYQYTQTWLQGLAKSNTVKWVFFGLIVAGVVVFAIWAVRKFLIKT